jgi:hypothetical protein
VVRKKTELIFRTSKKLLVRKSVQEIEDGFPMWDKTCNWSRRVSS